MTIKRRTVESLAQVPLGDAEVYLVDQQGVRWVVEHICDACGDPVTNQIIQGASEQIVCWKCLVSAVIGWHHAEAAWNATRPG